MSDNEMKEITREEWDKVVENSPYVFLTFEIDRRAREVEMFALNEDGTLDESRPMGTKFMPNLYFRNINSPFKHFESNTAYHADVDYIGEFNYSTFDYDTDYPELESTGFEVYDSEELKDLMDRLVPEKEFLKRIDEEKGESSE